MSDENKPDEPERAAEEASEEKAASKPEEKSGDEPSKPEDEKAGEEASKSESEKDDELPEDQRAETNIPEIDNQKVPLWIKLMWAGFVIWLIWYVVMGLQSEPSSWA